MSVAEIKEQLRMLSTTELAEIESLIAELRTRTAGTSPRIREAQPSDPDVSAAIDAVTDKHRDLLRRLAQ